MYAQHFGLNREPFSIAPDPRFLFMSEQHREALAHLLYGVGGGGGFVLLTGEIGAGKTTVCRCFLEQIPKHCDVAYIFNPKLTVVELLQTVCDEFHVQLPALAAREASVKTYVDALNGFLLAAHAEGRGAVLIIDEAQSLAPEVLEQLRLLTNLETHERKLLQIILIGQPELRAMLERPGLEQLAQRVIARYHLGALSAAETVRYVKHRLAVAGAKAAMPFEPAALARLHELTGGVPRRINLLAGRAMLGAYAHGRPRIDRATVDRAAAEVFARRAPPPRRERVLATALSVVAVLALALAGGSLWWQSASRAGPIGAASAASAADIARAGAVPAASAASAAVAAGSAAASAADGLAAGGIGDDPAALLAAAWADEDEAWRELARVWNVSLAAGAACQAVAEAGLACYRTQGGLATVRQLERPGLLALRLRDEAPVYAVLTALGERGAVLRTRARSWQLSPAALAGIWRGDYATLWRPPPGWRDGAEASPTGPLRTWLREQLSAAGADHPQLGLRERVWAFQVAHGLRPDGLAGPMTLMQLSRAVGVDEPRLKTAER